MVERSHASAAVPAVARPQGTLDRARVTRRAGDGPGPALQPHQARRRVLDVQVAIGAVPAVVVVHAGRPLPLLPREDAHSAVEGRGHLGIGGVHEPETLRAARARGGGGRDS